MDTVDTTDVDTTDTVDTHTLTDTDTTWARDLPMPNPRLKLKPNPVMDMLAVPSMVTPVTDTVTDMDTVMDTITAKDPLNLTTVMLVLLTIPVMPLHTLHLPPGVWENRL